LPKTSNYRLAKIHRNYTVEEAARLFGVHRNTVRQWIKRGLPVIAGHPVLFLGRDLRAFLKMRREEARRHCGPGEIYCMRCRTPRPPAGDMVEYQTISHNRGRIVALCCHCESVMYRSVNPSRIPALLVSMLATVPAGPRHIDESTQAIVNSDIGGEIAL
jgi:helix-turn-helix protein